MRGSRFFVVVTVSIVWISVGWAEPFIRPPDDTWPPILGKTPEWDTAYPYQRNVMIDFATDPATWPADPDNSSAWDLDPATNYGLYGSYDITLYASDWLELEVISGDAPTWYGSDPGGTSRTGLFGTYQASVPTVWRLTMHMDAVAGEQEYRRSWQELVIHFAGSGSYWQYQSTVPSYMSHRSYTSSQNLDPGWKVWNLWNQFTWAQGDWQFQHTVHLVEGGSFLVDDWHIATEATPEPVSAVLLLLGAPVALALSRRRGMEA